MTTHTSDGIELEVIRLLCKHQRSSYSRKVLSILEGEAPHGVCSLEINVPSYTNSARFADDYLLYSFLRKWKGFDAVGHTRDARTVDSWQAAERNCYRTNERIRSDLAMGYAPLTLILSVQRKILQVIGRFPPSSVYASCRWSGGATAEFRRGTLVQEKMCSSNFVTIGFEKPSSRRSWIPSG